MAMVGAQLTNTVNQFLSLLLSLFIDIVQAFTVIVI